MSCDAKNDSNLAIISLHMKSFKGELQRQNKLISSQRLFKILLNETEIIEIGQAVLEIFNFKDGEKMTEKLKILFLQVLHKLQNNRLCDIKNDKCTIQQ